MSIENADAALAIVEAGRLRVLVRLREAVEDQLRERDTLEAVDPAIIEELAQEGLERAGESLWRISLAEAAADEYGLSVRDALAHPAVATAEQLIGVAPDPGLDEVSTPWGPVEWDAPDPEPEPEWEATPVAREPEPEWEAVAAEPEPPPVAAEPAPQPVAAQPAAAPPPAPAAPDPQPVAPPPAFAPLRLSAVHTTGIESLKAGDKDIELSLGEAGLDVLRRSSGVALGRLDWGAITAIDVQEPKRRRGRKRAKHPVLAIQTGGGQAAFELVDSSDEDIAATVSPTLARLRASGLLSA